MRIPEVYGECMCCGRVIYSGDTFTSVWEEGKVVALECEECSDKESEENE